MFINHPEDKNLKLEYGHENSNPQLESSLGFNAEGHFVIKQEREENCPDGYSFHLNCILANKGKYPLKTNLEIQWSEEGYDKIRDYMYLGYDSGKTWQMLTIRTDNCVSCLEVVVPPGKHYLCVTPKFDNNDFDRLFDRYKNSRILLQDSVGKSNNQKDIKFFKWGNGAKKFLITTRAHAYETAGAYCCSQLLEDIVKGVYKQYSDIFELYVFPMINPDAVTAGNCCLAPSGINFGKGLHKGIDKDAGAKNISDFVLNLRPDYYLDMHNNFGPHRSWAFRASAEELLSKFDASAPDLSKFQKIWTYRFLDPDQDLLEGYLNKVCAKKFNTKYMITEFPWYLIPPPQMKRNSRKFFKTLFKIL